MNLKEFAAAQYRYNMTQVSEDLELSRSVQEHLVRIRLIEEITEEFSSVAIAALVRFQHDYDCYEPNILGPETATKLLELGGSDSRTAAKPLIIKTLKETLFKQLPIDEGVKTVGAPKDKELPVIFYEEVRGYLRLTLKHPLEGMHVWYVWAEDLEVVADTPTGGDVIHPKKVSSKVQLDVPYKSQLDNVHLPHATCNVTCLAMCMEFINPALKPSDGSQLEDNLYLYAVKNQLDQESPYDMAKIVEAHGVRDRFDNNASIEKVKAWLSNGNPAVTHGYFPHTSGHIIVLVGYDEKGFIVHDPNGEWFEWGYDRNERFGNNEKGKFKNYSYGLIERTCILENDPNGRFWIHYISVR